MENHALKTLKKEYERLNKLKANADSEKWLTYIEKQRELKEVIKFLSKYEKV